MVRLDPLDRPLPGKVGIGALAGGPVGALIGAGAGMAGGAMMPEDATTIANNFLGPHASRP